MSINFILQNLSLWSLQIAILSAAAALICRLAAFPLARARLAYWQTTLSACMFLPLFGPWKQEFGDGSVEVAAVFSAARQVPPASAIPVSLSIIAVFLILTGVLARLTWLTLGMWRLSRYRRNSQLLRNSPAQRTPSTRDRLAGKFLGTLGARVSRLCGLLSVNGGEAELRVSSHIAGPATFGFFKPVVLLPFGFTALKPSVRDAILRHELMHVRRRDWIFTLAEEIICALFWFHPAVWYLISEIRLSREEVVDFEVVAATGQREQYIDALLAVAGAPPAPLLSLAPPFLRTNRVKQRIVAILKDVPVSKTKRISTLAAGFTMLAVSAWLVTSALPLHAAPQPQSNPRPIRVGGGVSESNIISKVNPIYPPEAKAARVQGTVRLEATISKEGTIIDLVVLSGPDELTESALTAVRQWVYRPTLLNGEPVEVITTIDINYTLQK